MRIALLSLLFPVILLSGCGPEAERVTEIPWALTGDWLVADIHSHSRFSDGALTVETLVNRAVVGGCDALAITDHGDTDEEAASPAYFDAIRKARDGHPDLVIFAGLEWNIPPYGGREHVGVLVDPAREADLLSELKARFEAEGASAEEGLAWLRGQLADPRDAVLIYNHPSRKVDSAAESGAAMAGWRSVSPQMIGFEGAPGHQRADPLGSYRRPELTLDRWDPVAARVGGVWDDLLDQGQNIWAAVAVSDFHNDELDQPPCAFARIHVQVPQRSARGVLRALHAGSFWADHGGILDQLTLTVTVDGLAIPLSPGEAARVPASGPVWVNVYLQRGPGARRSPLDVELIGNVRQGGPRTLETRTLGPDQGSVSWPFHALKAGADGKSAYIRVRVRKRSAGGPDLMAYSNPIRLILF
ncbi:MAG: CehA/McbA family metallohydrolase [Chromatiales bacterium]|jgi:hypothetical protein